MAVASLQEHLISRSGGHVYRPEPRRPQAGINRADRCRSRCARLRRLAQARPRFLYRRPALLMRLERGAVNHKRVYRLHRPDGLAVRRSGGIDFVQECLTSGRPFRMLNVVSLASRECMVIEVDTSRARGLCAYSSRAARGAWLAGHDQHVHMACSAWGPLAPVCGTPGA